MALPGDVKKHDRGEQCEYDDCLATATREVCTESDSFGDEWEARCETHLPDPEAKDIGDCDRCEAQHVALVPTRDPEEIHGPVSYLCPSCLFDHRRYAQCLMDDLEDEMDEDDEEFYEDDDEPTLSVEEMRDSVMGWLSTQGK